MNNIFNFVSNLGLVMLLSSDMVLMSRFDFLTMLSWLILMTLLNFSKKIIIKYDFAVLSSALFTIFWFVVWPVRFKTKPFPFLVPHCILALVFYSLKKREKHRGKKNTTYVRLLWWWNSNICLPLPRMSSSRDVHSNLSFHSYSHMLIIMIIILLYKDVRIITRV